MKNIFVLFEKYQVFLYFFALVGGGLFAFAFPTLVYSFEYILNFSLVVLLYVTFLGVPFSRFFESFRDLKFLSTLLFLNFCVVPVVVWCLSGFLYFDSVLVFGVSLVLLTPCVDYVLVFSNLAGGNWVRLLSFTPVLMLLQIVLLPLYLYIFSIDVVFVIDWWVFVESFVLFILLPLVLAFLTIFISGVYSGVKTFVFFLEKSMVPLTFLVLFSVVVFQFFNFLFNFLSLLWIIPIYILFTFIMGFLAEFVGRILGFKFADRRVLIFSSVTRNSLVILPLTLSLPSFLNFVSVVVVVQTFVELVFMVLFVYLLPRFIVD